jgi:hypothetical protein
MHQWFLYMARFVNLFCSLWCTLSLTLSLYQLIERIKFLFKIAILSLNFFNFMLSFFAFLCLCQFLVFFSFEVLINCTLLEKLFHVLPFLKFMSNVNFGCLLSKAVFFIIWWLRIRSIFVHLNWTEWLLNFLQFELGKLKAFLCLVQFLFG